jgi:hypothetical protein
MMEDGMDRKTSTARAALALMAWAAWAPLGAPGAAYAQDPGEDIRKAQADIARMKKEIQRADAEVRRADSLMRDEAARAAQAEERQAKDRERRDKELAALQARLAETQGKIDAERNALARSQNAIDEVKAREAQLARTLAAWCDSLAARVEAGLPWDNQARLDRIGALRKDLEAGTATAEEGLARISAILREEVKAGDEIALFNRPVTRANGEVVNAQMLRLGNQWVAYMDEDGKRFGVLERRGGKWDWREDLSFAEKNRVKEAIEVKGAKAPPKLAVLDVGLSLGAPAAPPAKAAASPSPSAPAATGDAR